MEAKIGPSFPLSKTLILTNITCRRLCAAMQTQTEAPL
jgi:hypothetical protein